MLNPIPSRHPLFRSVLSNLCFPIKINRVFFVAFLFVSCSSNAGNLDVYSGNYSLVDGKTFVVIASEDRLEIKGVGINLFSMSDSRVDPRITAIEQRSIALIKATLNGDRGNIAKIMDFSGESLNEYVDNYLNVMAIVINDKNRVTDIKPTLTVYRDEDSDHGFEDNSWGWETYINIATSSTSHTVRLVWDGYTNKHMHTGMGKETPYRNVMNFLIRKPSRSWIRVYDPSSQTIKRLREIEEVKRADAIPARFVAYDVDTHQSVAVRFRKNSQSANMSIEVGPLGSALVKTGVRQN